MIVLASASPRRHKLLDMLRIPHEVDPAAIDEEQREGECPRTLAVRLAREKASAVAMRHPDRLVLGADTLVVLDGNVLGKPDSPEDAVRMLSTMTGRQHDVISAVALANDGEIWDRCDVTRVWFRSMDEESIRQYVATGEPMDKAGSYGVQGYGAMLVERIEGDFFGVMGLPVRLVAELLESAGKPYRFTR